MTPLRVFVLAGVGLVFLSVGLGAALLFAAAGALHDHDDLDELARTFAEDVEQYLASRQRSGL